MYLTDAIDRVVTIRLASATDRKAATAPRLYRIMRPCPPGWRLVRPEHDFDFLD
jgi:hypothetical protein